MTNFYVSDLGSIGAKAQTDKWHISCEGQQGKYPAYLYVRNEDSNHHITITVTPMMINGKTVYGSETVGSTGEVDNIGSDSSTRQFFRSMNLEDKAHMNSIIKAVVHRCVERKALSSKEHEYFTPENIWGWINFQPAK